MANLGYWLKTAKLNGGSVGRALARNMEEDPTIYVGILTGRKSKTTFVTEHYYHSRFQPNVCKLKRMSPKGIGEKK